jgi:hypothetical protein
MDRQPMPIDSRRKRGLMRASWWFIKRIKIASIVQATVPTTSPPPFSPGWVIAIFTIGISRFPRRTIDALGGVYALGHCGHRCQGQSCGNAKKYEFHDASLQSCFAIAFPRAVESVQGRRFTPADFALMFGYNRNALPEAEIPP